MRPYPPRANDPVLQEICNQRLNDIRDFNGILDTLRARVTVERYTTSTTIDGRVYQYNFNTDGGAITCTLPPGVINKEIKIVNTGTSGNTLTIAPNGTDKLIGVNSSFTLSDGESLIILYDGTDGWY